MGFPVAHLLLHVLQPVQAPQQAQLPPQGLFPAFLSRIMLRIRRPIISAITAIRRRLIQFAEIHMIIASHPFKALAAPGEERDEQLEEKQPCRGETQDQAANPDGN